MILITGAAGFIGRPMLRRFLEQGVACIGIDYVENPGLPSDRFTRLDVRDPTIGELMAAQGVDSIVHLAFCTKPKMDLQTRNAIDLQGSQNIIDCAVRNKVKNIVFASSGRVYGDQKHTGGLHDADGNYLNPLEDLYACNKVKAEKMFIEAARQHGFKLAILRLAIVCGPGGGPGTGDMLRAASRTGRYLVLGDKNPPVQLVHVTDVVNAFRAAIGKEGIFDIAADEKRPMLDLFAQAVRLGGVQPKPIKLPYSPMVALVWLLWKMKISPIPPLYLKMYGYDITRDLAKTHSILGKATYTVEQILEDIVKG